MSKTTRPRLKEKRPRRVKVTPDISDADLEMLEDARDENIISDEELLDMLSI